MSKPADTHYSKVACQLREMIQSGRLQPSEQLPSERHLCEQFRFSRITIRQALQLLEDEHLVERRHGSGTYVSPHPTYRIPLMIDYTGSMRLHAPRLGRRVLNQSWREADREVAIGLTIITGETFFYAERADALADETPVAWDQVHISAPFANGLKKEHLPRVDFIETWSKVCRLEIEFCQQSVEAVKASVEDKRNLGVPIGKPILKTIEVFHVQGGRRAGLFISHYNPEHIYLSSTFNWRTAAPEPERRTK
jgi:GntR family glv operon transcriptional regulator